MRFKYILLSALLIFLQPAASNADADSIKQKIIQESVASYPGNCPCPYNTDIAGRSCGRRSAYSKPGGYSPICYPSDVSEEMIKDFLARHPNVK